MRNLRFLHSVILSLRCILLPPVAILSDFQHSFDEKPDERTTCFAAADAIEMEGDVRCEVLRAACRIHSVLGGVALPHRYPTFLRTESPGWERIGEELNTLADAPQDSAAFRERYAQLIRGDVPITVGADLEPTARLQYDLQVGLLSSLGLLGGQAGQAGITAIDGKPYPLPAFEDVLARMQTPKLQTKLRQGFDTLLLVPFGLPLDRLLGAWRQGMRGNAATLQRAGHFDSDEPLWVWERYLTEPLVYDPRSFTTAHGGRTKPKTLAKNGRGWEVLLVEGALQNLPFAGEGQTVGGRHQIECGRSPAEYLHNLPKDEVGMTPEAYVVHFLDALERGGRLLDTGTFSSLPGAYFPTSRNVPGACWDPEFGQASLGRTIPGYRYADDGARVAVRVS